jgi:hypothetical protein
MVLQCQNQRESSLDPALLSEALWEEVVEAVMPEEIQR